MTQLASDNFTRANGALGTNWTANAGASSWVISSNAALATTGSLTISNYSAVAAPNDGYAEATIGSLVDTISDQGSGPAYRVSRSAVTLYLVQANTHETRLYKGIGGGFTQLGSDGPAVTTGDVLRLTCIGTSHTVTKNGTSIITAIDASIASGDAGIWGAPASGNNNISLFAFGNISSGLTLSLTGQGATLTAGSIAPANAKSLTGQAASFAAGSIAPTTTVGLTGQGGTFASGSVSTARSLSLLGQSSVFTAGTILPAMSKSLLGQSAVFTAGTITASIGGNVTLSLTGQAAAFATGTLSPSVAIALTGQSAAFVAGTLVVARSVSLLGTSAAFSSGSLSPAIALALLGSQAAFTAGTVVYSAGGNLTLSLTGQAASFTAGSIAPAMAQALTGQSGAFSTGILTALTALQLAGQRATFGTGALSNGGVSIALNGSRAVITAGILSIPSGFQPPRVIVSPDTIRIVYVTGDRTVRVGGSRTSN